MQSDGEIDSFSGEMHSKYSSLWDLIGLISEQINKTTNIKSKI